MRRLTLFARQTPSLALVRQLLDYSPMQLPTAAALALALLALGAPTSAVAGQNPGGPGSPGASGGPDFLFAEPTRSFGLRATFLLPREEGELFTFVRDQLTVDKGDFRTVAIAGEFGHAITSRATLIVGADASRASVGSETRHFIGSDGLPILQESTLNSGGLNIGVKLALMNPGRRISRYAWIPRTITPYVGAAGGAAYYHFRQHGEFVDFADLSIFKQTFDSKGWGPSAHLFAGADVRAWKNLYLTVEGRYVWAHADLGLDFVGFDGIDLAGFRMASGVNLVF